MGPSYVRQIHMAIWVHLMYLRPIWLYGSILCTSDPYGYMGLSYVLSSDNWAKIRGTYPNHTHVHKTDPYKSSTPPWTDFMLTTNQTPPMYIKWTHIRRSLQKGSFLCHPQMQGHPLALPMYIKQTHIRRLLFSGMFLCG